MWEIFLLTSAATVQAGESDTHSLSGSVPCSAALWRWWSRVRVVLRRCVSLTSRVRLWKVLQLVLFKCFTVFRRKMLSDARLTHPAGCCWAPLTIWIWWLLGFVVVLLDLIRLFFFVISCFLFPSPLLNPAATSSHTVLFLMRGYLNHWTWTSFTRQ